jgi:hypothetical protein
LKTKTNVICQSLADSPLSTGAEIASAGTFASDWVIFVGEKTTQKYEIFKQASIFQASNRKQFKR